MAYVSPINFRTDPPAVHVLIIYKQFAPSHSHIGLGIAALNNAKVLQDNDIMADARAANSAEDIRKLLIADPTVTHVVISAPWVPIADMLALVAEFPRLTFAVNYHSNVAFLQADVRGVTLLREYIDLDLATTNFFVAGNSPRFVEWLRAAYAAPAVLLQNMYFLGPQSGGNVRLGAQRDNNGTLKIGSFGAPRILKNMLSAAAGALEISQELHRDTEFWMNSRREDSGAIKAVQELLQDIPGITLKLAPWDSWSNIRRLIRRMDLLINPSFTESFCIITADGVAEGVPSVVGDSIHWVPSNWKVIPDNVPEIARVGRGLIGDSRAPHDGLLALERNNERGLTGWSRFLGAPRIYKWHYLSPDAA